MMMQRSRRKEVTEFTVSEPVVTEPVVTEFAEVPKCRSMVAEFMVTEFTVSEPVVTEPVEVSNYRSMVAESIEVCLHGLILMGQISFQQFLFNYNFNFVNFYFSREYHAIHKH